MELVILLKNYAGYGGEVGGALFCVAHSNFFPTVFAMNMSKNTKCVTFVFINRHIKTYTIMICTIHMKHILVEGIFELTL